MALWQRGAGGSTGSPTCGEDLVERRLLRVAAGVLLRLAVQRAFLPVNFALPLNSLTTPDEIIDSRSEPVEDQMSVCLVTTRFHLVGEVQVGKLAPTWENSQHVLAMAASGHGFRKLIRLLKKLS